MGGSKLNVVYRYIKIPFWTYRQCSIRLHGRLIIYLKTKLRLLWYARIPLRLTLNPSLKRFLQFTSRSMATSDLNENSDLNLYMGNTCTKSQMDESYGKKPWIKNWDDSLLTELVIVWRSTEMRFKSECPFTVMNTLPLRRSLKIEWNSPDELNFTRSQRTRTELRIKYSQSN